METEVHVNNQLDWSGLSLGWTAFPPRQTCHFERSGFSLESAQLWVAY